MKKVILIGEEHIAARGPYVLLNTLKELKENGISCSIALELPSIEHIDNLFHINFRYIDALLFAQLQRKAYVLESMALFPAFATDLANMEEDRAIRDEIMAFEILERSSDVVVMLVGALHLEGISQHLKNNGVEVLSCAPKKSLGMHLFPSIIHHVANEHGFFYDTGEDEMSAYKRKINQFIRKDYALPLVVH